MVSRFWGGKVQRQGQKSEAVRISGFQICQIEDEVVVWVLVDYAYRTLYLCILYCTHPRVQTFVRGRYRSTPVSIVSNEETFLPPIPS